MYPVVNQEVVRKVQKAMAGIIIDQPFFATLLLKLRLYQDPSIPTACTDGFSIRYNPDFFDRLSLKEVTFVLVHEVMHVSNAHPFRLGSRDPYKFNQAGDYVINGILKDCGFTLLDGVLIDSQYDGMSAEQVYAKLPDRPKCGQRGNSSGGNQQGQPQQGQGDSDGTQNQDPGGCGGFEHPKDEHGNKLSEGEAAQQEAEWRVAVQQAAQAAKVNGKLPASLARLVEDIATPYLNWREILRVFVQNTAKSDYDWTRPNRRHVANGLYLPSIRGDELKPIVVAIDTSGSIGANELSQFGGELNDILAAFPCTVHVVYCDSRIAKVETYTSDDYPVKLGNYGGGGTDFRPVFDFVEGSLVIDGAENPQDVAAIIYLTDLYGPSPEQSIGVPTLWVSTTCPHHLPEGYTPSFGEIAFLNS